MEESRGTRSSHGPFRRYFTTIGILVDSEIDLSTRYGKDRVFINKALSTETAYQHLKTLSTETTYQQGLIVGKLGKV
jgi:hypothetical protein